MTEALDLPPPATKTDILWFLPTHDDGRYLGSEIGARHVSLGYLSQIARAADELGYYGVLLPTGRSCEDSLGYRLGDGSPHPSLTLLGRGASWAHGTGVRRAHGGHA